MTLLVGSIFHMTRKIVSEMTYNVSMGTLNPTIPSATWGHLRNGVTQLWEVTRRRALDRVQTHASQPLNRLQYVFALSDSVNLT